MMRTFFPALALAVFAPLAAAQSIYKCTEPGNRIVYTDDPKTCTGTAVRVEAPQQPNTPPPPASLSKSERELVRQADQRTAALAKAYDDVVAAFNKLRAAEARRDAGIEPQEGERQGRRYRREYWERQQGLRQEVEQAREELDEALDRRNALR